MTEPLYLIYKAISPSKKIYIGQTCNIDVRKYSHGLSSLNKNSKEYNYYFHNAIRKHKIENIEWQILNKNLTKNEANMWERLWIFIEKSNDPKIGYNETEGGENPPINNRVMRQDTKDKISLANKGRKRNQKVRDQMSKTRKERKIAVGKNNAMFGKKHKEETLQKMRKPKSEEHKKKISETKKGKFWKKKI
jgi:group I intron endonuclease